MASAQVLPDSVTSSRKQEHLEAGKRRLEEFRKKKAADRAKKAASSSQLDTADAGLCDKPGSDSEHARLTDSDGAGTSDGFSKAVIEPSSDVIKNDTIESESVQKNEPGSSNDTRARPPLSGNGYNISSAYFVQTRVRDKEFSSNDASGSSGPINVNYSPLEKEKNDNFGIYTGASRRLADGIVTEQIITPYPPSFRDIDSNSSQYSYNGLHEALSNNSDSHLKDFAVVNPASSHVVTNVSPENSGKTGYSDLLATGHSSSLYEGSFHGTPSIKVSSYEVGQNTQSVLESNNPLIFDMDERKLSGSVGHLTSANGPSLWPSESKSMGFSFDIKSSPNHVPLSSAVSGTSTRRSRPSFLDSINMPRVSPASLSLTEGDKADSFSSKVYPMDALATAASQNSLKSSVEAANGGDLFRHGVNESNTDRKHEFYSRKQDEDFATLEQHIEDLTQEKFSLQRALGASQTLVESLAAENSALTDNYNQQGSVVNQLKSDIEKLQEDIRIKLVELESVKIEYANAQMECNAADERAKLLASEVIGLEEKALRLRSSELKLERQLENSQAEISSFKRKMSSLEKDRQDLQSTIDALQEEKKLLQSKLRKASASGKLVDVGKSLTEKKDISTSTEDLVNRDDADFDTSIQEMHTSALLGSDASSFPLHPENRLLNFEDLSLNIPPDQMRMIQSINTIISELALEKEELMQTLSAELSQSSKLKELNKELSRKLEAQTQRLELLTAQSMVNNNTSGRQLNSRAKHENTPYADEGDEVVERVLGWIMMLFPGGPSRRRTSKLI